MKLNLGCGADIRHGYKNIDRVPIPQAREDMFKLGNIESLDWLLEDDNAEEILALDCVQYLPAKAIKPAITNWCQKLSQGGIIKIAIPDCLAVARAFEQGQFSLNEFLQITFGTQENGDTRLSALDRATLLQILKEAGVQVVSSRYEGVGFYVEATKC